MKAIDEYETIEELEKDFNDWFGWLITGFDKEKGWYDNGNSVEENLTDDKIEMMLAITKWEFEEDDFNKINKLNFVYWYCVDLLYTKDEDYFYYEDVYHLLDGIRPF